MSHTAKGYSLKDRSHAPPRSKEFAKEDAGNAIFVVKTLSGNAEVIEAEEVESNLWDETQAKKVFLSSNIIQTPRAKFVWRAEDCSWHCHHCTNSVNEDGMDWKDLQILLYKHDCRNVKITMLNDGFDDVLDENGDVKDEHCFDINDNNKGVK